MIVHRENSLCSLGRRTACAAMRTFFLAGVAGCGGSFNVSSPTDPFADAPLIPLDAKAHLLRTNLASLGPLDEGDALFIRVDGDSVEAVFILIGDDQQEATGVIVGGGPGDAAIDFRAVAAGTYFVFLEIALTSRSEDVRLTASLTKTAAPRPQRQVVVVSFDDAYLTNPGLWDPLDATQADRDLLDSLSELVADGIMTMLRDMFADSPIEIVAESEAPPGEPTSRLTFKPDRVLADDQNIIDTALPPPDQTRPQCQERVVFGETLPRGAAIDLGNHILDDDAVVYVGSFQGRGEECWLAAINSVNNIVLSLSQTAAHEIGHLVGLHHV